MNNYCKGCMINYSCIVSEAGLNDTGNCICSTCLVKVTCLRACMKYSTYRYKMSSEALKVLEKMGRNK